MLNCTVRLDRHERFETRAVGTKELVMTGQVTDGKQGKSGVRYAARIRIRVLGGSVESGNGQLQVTKADEVLILFAGETDYHGSAPRERRVQDPLQKTKEVLDQAAEQSFEMLKKRHIDPE
jgi:hypothetical protein